MSELSSWLPPGGANLFQAVKQMCQTAENAGVTLYKLTIGQPQGAAILAARAIAAQATLNNEEQYHEYQDNGCLPMPDFAQRFVWAHLQRSSQILLETRAASYLPIPGIKPMLIVVPLACGANQGKGVKVGSMTKPGYPTPADACNYLGIDQFHLNLTPENDFRFIPDLCPAYGQGDVEHHTNLLMLNYPHNPTGQVADRAYWERIIEFCIKHKIRLFNDGAYAMLRHQGSSGCMLAEVAPFYSELSWAEAFSASKSIGNGTGWRVGAIVGSPDFVSDWSKIKGNVDSGFVAPMAVGALYALENSRSDIDRFGQLYEKRLDILVNIAVVRGLKLAVNPQAGFFSLWLVPKEAFGQKVKDAEHFNELMIRNTGIAGVHFNPGYIRYAVAGSPVEKQEWQEALKKGFESAQVAY